jgi:hypothetical protein
MQYSKVAIFFLAFSGTAILKPLVGAGEVSCRLNGTSTPYSHDFFYIRVIE